MASSLDAPDAGVAQDMFLRSIWIHQTPSLNRASTCRIDVAHISGATVTEIVSLNYLIESVDASFGGQHEMIVIPGRGIQVLVGDKIRFDLTADFRVCGAGAFYYFDAVLP